MNLIPLCVRAVFSRASGRSPKWPAVSAKFLKANPKCAVCGKPARVAHHVIPFHIDSSRELDPSNLMPFCGSRCHLPWGHLFNWRSYNPRAREDAAAMRYSVLKRPRTKDEFAVGFERFLRLADCAVICLVSIALLAGCAGPNPVQFKISLFSVYSPHVTVAPASPTNAVTEGATARISDANALTLNPTQRGTLICFDNLFAFPVGSGTATSNETLSHITFTPLN